MFQSFTFFFHAFISANIIPSSNHLCRKTYRLAGVYLENYSWQVFFISDSQRDCYAPAVQVEVFDAADCCCCKLAYKAKKQGFFRQKTLIASDGTVSVDFSMLCGAYCSDAMLRRTRNAVPLPASSLIHSCTSGSFECEDELPLLFADRHDGQAIAAP